MKQWQIWPGQPLKQIDVPLPKPGPREVRVRMRAASLNFRDHLLYTGRYPIANDGPVVPLSDGAGEVTCVGTGLTTIAVGDRVTATTITNWLDGTFEAQMRGKAIGFTVPGWLTEEIVLPETSLVKIPESMSYDAAATLPCAGVTAWNAVIETARIGPGDSVLVQGTGGVSMFAIQLAKTVGAHTIVTSSSDRKLAQACQLGADKGINYSSNSDWDTTVKKMSGGEGVDLVIENAGTVRQSIQATRWGGLVAVIGALASFSSSDNLPDTRLPNLLRSGVTVSPIMMGNRRMLTRMVRTYETNKIVPVIDKRFAFRDAPAAYNALAAAEHIGKIVIAN